MLWFVVPVDPGISWEGHLSGFLVGLAFAFIYKQKIAKPPKFEWEKPDYREEDDDFMKHFDENGNFIEASLSPNEAPLSPNGENNTEIEIPNEIEKRTYTYIYKRNAGKD